MASRRDFETGGNEFDQRHVFLMTDGEPSCSASAMDDQCNRSSQEVGRLADSDVDVTVFALSEALQTSACLTDLADLGGTTAPIVAATNEILKEQAGGEAAAAGEGRLLVPAEQQRWGDRSTWQIYLNGKFVKRDPARMDGWDFEDRSARPR